MHNYDIGTSGTWTQGPGSDPERGHQRSVLSLVLLIVGVAVAAALGLSVAFWALGLVFHLAGFILKVALVVAVAAFVWKRIMKRRCI